MARRHNHYEAAFEDYLRSRRIAYVAVDEKRRAVERHGTLKSLDFIVSVDGGDPNVLGGLRWLVDVKGRRFPSSGKQYWRNWTTEEELESLVTWSDRFGPEFHSVLVFAFELVADRSPTPPHEIHFFRDRAYAFVAVDAREYRRCATQLSASWKTVSVPAAEFRRLATPVSGALSSLAERVAAST